MWTLFIDNTFHWSVKQLKVCILESVTLVRALQFSKSLLVLGSLGYEKSEKYITANKMFTCPTT